MVQTIEDGDGYTIEYDDELHAVVHRWDRFVQGDAFRDGCEALLPVIEDRNATKLLIDSREQNVVKDEDIEWMFTDWVPRSAEAGIRYSATVYEQSTIAKMNMEKIGEYVEEAEDGGEAHMTADIDDARSWLQRQ